MANTLSPINPLEYITHHDPVPQMVRDPRGWFTVEKMSLTIGEYVGKPDRNSVLKVGIVQYLVSEGWRIESVSTVNDYGSWLNESTSEREDYTHGSTDGSSKVEGETASTTNGATSSTTNGSSTSDTANVAVGESNGSSSSASTSTSSSEAYSIPWLDERKATSSGNAQSSSSGSSSGNTSETSNTNVSGTTNSTTEGTTENVTEGTSTTDTSSHSENASRVESKGVTKSTAPYWSASIHINFSRRRLQSDKIMKDMLEDLTLAYNEGRKINDDRYDEIVSLYSIMLGRNEDEGNNFILQTSDLKPLTDAVLASMKKSINDFHAVADNLADDVFKNRVKMINLKFDNELSTSRATLITAGLYNSTTWITTSAGIERNREMALNDLIETKIDIYVKVANAGTEIGNKFMDSAARIQAMAKERLLSPAETRNNVFKWMLDFMERRKDLFPSLDQVAGAAKQFGSGDMAVANGQ